MARRTSSSKGASGMSRLPFTPPLFLIAVRMSPSDRSLHAGGVGAWRHVYTGFRARQGIRDTSASDSS